MEKQLNPLEMTLDELSTAFHEIYGKGAFHAAALYREIYKKGNPQPLEAAEFQNSPRLSDRIRGHLIINPGRVVETARDGELLKFVTALADGSKIESVIIPMQRYNTLCISSQVGCRMGCIFCETGKMGFKRNLVPAEITGQLYNATHHLKREIHNVVFMGMGEPLDNLDAVIRTIRVMSEQKGFDIALRHITISTAGLVLGIERLAGLNLPGIRLAISLNAPDDAIRSSLMPINRKNPMAALKKALTEYPLGKRGIFFVEYILIRGVNDSKSHAKTLADFLRPLPVRLNLIAYNPVKEFAFVSPTDDEMQGFKQHLTQNGLFVTARWSRGRSVIAGCGQLGRN